MKILVIDDEKSILVTLSDALKKAGYDVETAATGTQGLKALEKDNYDCVISDIRLPDMTGDRILEWVRKNSQETRVILMTAYADVSSAVEAMRNGAYDYVAKPFLNDEIIERVKKVKYLLEIEGKLKELQSNQKPAYIPNLVYKSKQMKDVMKTVMKVAPTDASVLIEGESGVGKEKVAQAIHQLSKRAKKPFVIVSVSLFPTTLIESELFGHVKGAFTDAKTDKKGRFEIADGGTIFIDDIDDLPLDAQVKLLRVLQTHQIEKVGDSCPINVDVRVIAATKKDLLKLCKEGKFREDLYYRLNVIKLTIPPLRDRPDDIPELAMHFIRLYGAGRNYKILPDTLLAMQAYPWNGNVRELENAIQRAIALAGDTLEIRKENLFTMSSGEMIMTLREHLDKTEKEYIIAALNRCSWNKGEAAKLLGISRKDLYKKLHYFGLIGDPDEDTSSTSREGTQ